MATVPASCHASAGANSTAALHPMNVALQHAAHNNSAGQLGAPMPWPAAAGGAGASVKAAPAAAAASTAPFVPLVLLGGMNVAAAPSAAAANGAGGGVLQQHGARMGLMPRVSGMSPMPIMMPASQRVSSDQVNSVQLPTVLSAPPQQPPQQQHGPRGGHPQQHQQPSVQLQMLQQAVQQAVNQQRQQRQQQQQQQGLLLAPPPPPPPPSSSSSSSSSAAAATAAAVAAAASGPSRAPSSAAGGSSVPSGPGRPHSSGPERHVTREAFQKLFHLPLGQAAKQLGLGQSQFKVHARRHGISRWPYRKRQSVDQLIQSIEAYAQTTNEAAASVAPALAKLRSFLAAIEHDPDIDLDQPLKRLRQAFFKETHKLRQRARLSEGLGHEEVAAAPAAAAAAAGSALGQDTGGDEYECHRGSAGAWLDGWGPAAAAGVQGSQLGCPPLQGWSEPVSFGSSVLHHQHQHMRHAAHDEGHELDDDDGLAGVLGQLPSSFDDDGGGDDGMLHVEGRVPHAQYHRAGPTPACSLKAAAAAQAPAVPTVASGAAEVTRPGLAGPPAVDERAVLPGSGGGLVQLLQAGQP